MKRAALFLGCFLLICFLAAPALCMGPKPNTRPVETPQKHKGSWTEPLTGMEFVWVDGGTFLMGCDGLSADCDLDENPSHTVQLEGFWIGKTEVTQAQWEKVMGFNPSYFAKGGDYPVENVSWTNAQEFIRRFTASSDMKYWFSLPSEAQWEYACRACGRQDMFAGSSVPGDVAWFMENSGGSTHPVAAKAPNGLGAYDLSGNVWEWCKDNYDVKAYSKHEPNDPVFQSEEPYRVIRGGSWNFPAFHVRCGVRNDIAPGDGYYDIGFRLVRTN